MEFISEILFIIYICFLLIAGAFTKAYGSIREQWYTRIFYIITFVFLIILSLILCYDISKDVYENSLFSFYVINYQTQLLKVFILCSSLFVLVSSVDFLVKEALFSFDYLILILFSIFGMFVLVSANDLMILYMALELQGLAFYVITSYNVGSLYSTEAGLKYFFIGSFASILILFGIVLQYYTAGTTNYNGFYIISKELFDSYLSILGPLFIITGFLFKLAVAPFHIWIADVYEGAITSVTAFFIIVPKIVLIFTLVFNLGFFILYKADLEDFIMILSLISVIVGSFAALYQVSIKRLFAYSAVVHMGFLFLGLAIGTKLSLISVFVYLFIYITISINFFSVLLSLTNYVNFSEFNNLKSFSGLYRSHGILGLILVLNVFALVGVPPLSGFFGKAFILLAAAEVRLIGALLLFIFTSVVSAFYYLRLIKIFVYEKNEAWYFLMPINKNSAYVITLFTFLNIFFMLYSADIIVMFTYLFV